MYGLTTLYCMYVMMASNDSQSFDVVELLSLFASKTMSGSSKAISLPRPDASTLTHSNIELMTKRIDKPGIR